MAFSKTRRAPRRGTRLSVDSLEGRQLLSHMPAHLPAVAGHPATVQTAAFGFPGKIKVSDPGQAAILSALNGGAGSEFVQLLRREVRNINGVIASFAIGARSSFSAPGFAARLPKSQPGYTGPVIDQLNGTVAGALLRPDGSLELAAIMRGPVHNPVPSYYIWGIDRGGPSNANTTPGLPGVHYDSEVIVAVTPSGISGSVRDLQTDTTSAISGSQISVKGSTIRVFVSPSLLPANNGVPASKFRFGFWAATDPDGGNSAIESFVPNDASIPVGIQPGKAPRRR